eukprot:gnl/TRDRNA2_/TRDRNA2_40889_c0_seq1.p1 gnl/TRDRNA2_/TRDRNA2_40889_c0~~gnl/TRDRNA2_/TRDRNA2_40889_c0_seq1.p1  ORF type:complete len:681 (+),score=63.48 gnl/TRDRNA2_/TRDRNA2_40889_c0_seq1:70-2112(+)
MSSNIKVESGRPSRASARYSVNVTEAVQPDSPRNSPHRGPSISISRHDSTGSSDAHGMAFTTKTSSGRQSSAKGVVNALKQKSSLKGAADGRSPRSTLKSGAHASSSVAASHGIDFVYSDYTPRIEALLPRGSGMKRGSPQPAKASLRAATQMAPGKPSLTPRRPRSPPSIAKDFNQVIATQPSPSIMDFNPTPPPMRESTPDQGKSAAKAVAPRRRTLRETKTGDGHARMPTTTRTTEDDLRLLQAAANAEPMDERAAALQSRNAAQDIQAQQQVSPSLSKVLADEGGGAKTDSSVGDNKCKAFDPNSPSAWRTSTFRRHLAHGRTRGKGSFGRARTAGSRIYHDDLAFHGRMSDSHESPGGHRRLSNSGDPSPDGSPTSPRMRQSTAPGRRLSQSRTHPGHQHQGGSAPYSSSHQASHQTNHSSDPSPAVDDVEVKNSRQSHHRHSLWHLAIELRIPVEALRAAFELFEEHSDNGELSADGFANVLCTLTHVSCVEELPNGMINDCFMSADKDRSDGLDFAEFARWFSRHGFSEEVLLTQEQRELRTVARRYQMPLVDVERYKAAFDSYDSDNSGMIDYDEFVKLLYVLIKVPNSMELPVSRVKQFWSEVDTDGSGSIGFEEFLVFYKRFFADSPLEAFYSQIRPVNVRHKADFAKQDHLSRYHVTRHTTAPGTSHYH